ncbi:MAG: hypothetical protein ACOYIH_09995 [Candidatus Fimadaptatus sp.]|jgi:glycosyl-4,4'-diaponeurosporenoate acyltransferase
MGEAIMGSSFMQWLIECMRTLMTSIVILALIGPLSFVLGELFPRRWVRYNRFPFNEYGWEKDGALYRKLRVNEWKDKVPDMSNLFKWMFPKKSIAQERTAKYFERFVIETCVAEAVHVLLMIAGYCVYFFVFHNAWGFIVSTLYALGNLPFVLIQRYNRPRFKMIMERQKQLDARRKAAAGEDS